MQVLKDLVDHGVLPFVGRRAECDQVIRFWRDTVDAQGLRALLIVGEAGIGKSRLASYVGSVIQKEKGAVIHVRLYAESPTALGPILAEAISSADVDLRLLRTQVTGVIGDVAAALRRLCRLRPTLVIIEDIHLLDGEALRDASQLLAIVKDETLSLLCLARPAEMPARRVLEPYLVQTMNLTGLTKEDLELLCVDLFGHRVTRTQLQRLHKTAHGNPLALRTVLRTLIPRAADGTIITRSVDDEDLARALEGNVDLLAEGMVSHLSDSERAWGEKLASLGEVFARSTAVHFLEDAETALERLLYLGVIAQPIAHPVALQGTLDNDQIFAFTHSLLYDYLVARRRGDVAELIRMVNAGRPFFSIVPLLLIEEGTDRANVPISEFDVFVQRMGEIVNRTISTRDWRVADRSCRAAAAVLCRVPNELHAILELQVQAMKIAAFVRYAFSRVDEYAELLAPLMDGTARPRDVRTGELRILALHHAIYLTVLRSWDASLDDEREQYWNEIHDVIARWPELRGGRTYALALVGAAQAAGVRGLGSFKALVEAKLGEIREEVEIDPLLKQRLLERALVFFIDDFSTEEECQLRQLQLEQLEQSPYVDRPLLMVRRLSFFTQTGWIDRAREVIATALPYFILHEQQRNVFSAKLALLTCRMLAGEEFDIIERDAYQMLSEYDQSTTSGARDAVALELFVGALLRLDYVAVDRIVGRFGDTQYREDFSARQAVLQLLASDVATAIGVHAAEGGVLMSLKDGLLSGVLPIETLDQLRDVVGRPVLRLTELADRIVLLLLLNEIPIQYPSASYATEIGGLVKSSVVRLLEWLEVRRLFVIGNAVVKRFGPLLGKRDAAAWRGRGMGPERPEGRGDRSMETNDGKTRIGMFGCVQAISPRGEVIPIRGERLSTMLGLMTLERMMPEPFGTREFRYLAAGKVENPEHARKTMNAAVFRLRELLGVECILTRGAIPELNLEALEVDILRANDKLIEANRGLRDGSLLRARSALVHALDVSRGEVPFPSLYEEVFETARMDFEFRLREVVLRVSATLMREADLVSAEEILQKSYRCMPEDEEIVEALCSLLESTGRQTEARLLRVKQMFDETDE